MRKSLNYFTAIKFLYKYMKNYIAHFAIFFSGWFIDMVISIITPKLIGTFIDEIVYYDNLETFLKISVVIFLTIVFWCVLYVFIYAQHQYLMSKFTFDIKRDIFRKIHKCDSQILTDIPKGELLTILQNYSHECMFFIIRNIIHFINGIIKIIIISVALIFIDPFVGIFLFAASLVNVLISTLFGKREKRYGSENRAVYNKYISWLLEVISSVTDIKVLNALDKVQGDFYEKQNSLFKIDFKSGINTIHSSRVIEVLTLIIRLSIYVMCGLLAVNGGMTLGSFMFVLALAGILIEQVKWTSSSLVDSQGRIAYIEQIANFLSNKNEDMWKGKRELCVDKGAIKINNVAFSYDNGFQVFNKLNISIEAGKKTAIVGENGSGKSTLSSILTGYLIPNAGSICIDGINLREYSLKSIRKNIGIVTQEIFIFSASIRENVCLGNRAATDKEILDACEKAGLSDFMETLPEGLNTHLEENGSNISGGQKQRIAIARLYLMNPPIIIFDETTSALDKSTELEVIQAWNDVLENRTSIIITHKPNIIELCDNVIVLKNKCAEIVAKREHNLT